MKPQFNNQSALTCWLNSSAKCSVCNPSKRQWIKHSHAHTHTHVCKHSQSKNKNRHLDMAGWCTETNQTGRWLLLLSDAAGHSSWSRVRDMPHWLSGAIEHSHAMIMNLSGT